MLNGLEVSSGFSFLKVTDPGTMLYTRYHSPIPVRLTLILTSYLSPYLVNNQLEFLKFEQIECNSINDGTGKNKKEQSGEFVKKSSLCPIN